MAAQIDYVVTCFNKAKYIRHVLESILDQQGNFAKRIIIVDDGSTDQSVQIIKEFQQTCPIPIMVIEQENAGPARAQNRGLKEIEAPYIKLLDGDDVLAPYATAHLFNALERNSNCILSFGVPTEQGTYEITAEGKINLPISNNASDMKPVEVIHDPLMDSLRSARTTPSALLTKKEVIEKTGGSNPDVFIQDYSFELEAAYLGKFAKVSTPIFYAPNELGERMSGNDAQTLHDVNMAIAYFVARHPNLGKEYKNYALYRCTSRAAKWAKRHRASQLSLRLTLMKFLAKLPLYTACFKKLSLSCEAFKHSHPIRVPK